MNGILTGVSIVVCALILLTVPNMVTPYVADYGVVTVFDVSKALLLCTALATLAGWLSYRQSVDGPFLLRLFLSALLLRMILGTIIFVSNGQNFFGGDALTYDFFGSVQLQGWGGDRYSQLLINSFMSSSGSGWGMVYLVAAVYGIVGRNMIAVQFVNSVLGAGTAVIVFLCAFQVFNNLRVARVAGLAVAFYPSLVLWSSQGLKDGPIVFFLGLSMLATLKLGEKLTVKYIVILVGCLLAILSLRFYVFYMICVAVAGAFVIGMQSLSQTSFFRQFAVIVLLGLALSYFGVNRAANIQFERYGTLEAVQRSRDDAARSAQSGFGKDVDVSTTKGALSVIPLGLLYLFFAPFPWQLVSLRQSLTLPEMIIWWASFPMMVLGLWFSIRYRLRMISPILIFTLMLSLAYSIFQGNVGTAYRQRAQLQVFYFIFVAVGVVLILERRDQKNRAIVVGRQMAANASVASTLARRQELRQ